MSGELLLTSNGEALTGVYPASHKALPDVSHWRRDDRFFTGVRDQLAAYFAGALREFDVPLDPVGTPFQKQVWQVLRLVSYGSTWTYQQVAEYLGKPRASRAVGLANSKNPISIIVPCHRVIGANGSLSGYAGGVSMKRWLLEHEANAVGTPVLGRAAVQAPLAAAADEKPTSQRIW